MTEANKQDEPGLGGFPTAGGIEPGVLDDKIEEEDRLQRDDDSADQAEHQE